MALAHRCRLREIKALHCNTDVMHSNAGGTRASLQHFLYCKLLYCTVNCPRVHHTDIIRGDTCGCVNLPSGGEEGKNAHILTPTFV